MILKNPIEKDVLSKIANLHKENIKTGFLSSLGDDFLICVYKSISIAENSILITYIKNNEVVGFISGTLDITEIKKNLKKKCFPIFMKLAIKLVLNPIKLKKLFETYKYSSEDKKSYPFNLNAELLSIVVSPNHRGKGIAPILYKELIKSFKEKNIKEFKIVVGAQLKEAQKFYEKMGAEKVAEFELHKGEKSFIYIQKVD